MGFSTAITLNWLHWTWEIFPQRGFPLTLSRFSDIELQQCPGKGVFDCHHPELMKLDLEKVPPMRFSTATASNRWQWTSRKCWQWGFRLPPLRIDDIGPGENPRNGFFDCHRPKLITLDVEKGLAIGTSTTMTLNWWHSNRESSTNVVFDCHCLESMTLDFEKVPAKRFSTASSSN